MIKDKKNNDKKRDKVEQASRDSFPASDPPGEHGTTADPAYNKALEEKLHIKKNR